jgi:hypothetical protein
MGGRVAAGDTPVTATGPITAELPHLAPVLAACAVGMGWALQLANGSLHPDGIFVLGVSIVMLAAALAAPRLRFLEAWGEPTAFAMTCFGVTYQLWAHLTSPPGIYLRATPADYVWHHLLVAAAAVVIGAGLVGERRARRLVVPALLAIHFALGVWTLRAAPEPFIDVFVWHREAYGALAADANPYALAMPNIYGHTLYYGAGLADPMRVHVGFPYPPLSLLVVAPAHLLVGDYRYANLVALGAAGALMATARPGRLAFGAAALFLFTPRHWFVLEAGWTDPLVAFFLALVVFSACRAPRAVDYALGLLLAVKQYAVLLVPLAPLLFAPSRGPGRLGRRFATIAAVAGAVTIPFALWDAGSFFRSVVRFQALQPFRPDSLSFMAYLADDGVPTLPSWLSFALVAAGLALALWRAPRTAQGYAASCALVLLLFFGVAKQAFCNYYFVVVAALCCALAASEPARRGAPPVAATAARPA